MLTAKEGTDLCDPLSWKKDRYPVLKTDSDFRSPLKLKFAVPETTKHIGGVTIFGSGFGNYNQDIHVCIGYKPIYSEEK